MLIQACLNGSRDAPEHAALPISPQAIAADARAVVRAGAGAVHVHPRDAEGHETLWPDMVGATVSAVRAVHPALQISVTTGAWIEPDPERRLVTIATWPVLPDCASVNLSEEGAIALIELLNAMGVSVEAGISTIDDAHLMVREGLDAACERVLVEIDSFADAREAVRLAGAIDAVLDDGQVHGPRLHHGSGITTWAVMESAMERGHDVRVGLEDTLVLNDGSLAPDNAALVRLAVEHARRAGRHVEVHRA